MGKARDGRDYSVPCPVKKLKGEQRLDGVFERHVVRTNGKPNFAAYIQDLREVWVYSEGQRAERAVKRAVAESQALLQHFESKGKHAEAMDARRCLLRVTRNADLVLAAAAKQKAAGNEPKPG